MTRHLASTRSFPGGYSQTHPTVATSDAFRGRPGSGGALVVSLVTIPQPVALGGQPFLGMDPSAPATWTRPYNPQPGMVARLNFDGAKMQTDTPMGQTWRNPLRDRADVPAGPVQHAGRSKRTWRRR